jgi:hypothetical protein
VKTSGLIGAQLDWAVAQCEKVEVGYINGGIMRRLPRLTPFTGKYQPSTKWSQGGPIIEREEIDIYCYTSPKISPDAGLWLADITGTNFKAYGSTPLIAAMRCYVASKLGNEVEVPEELS